MENKTEMIDVYSEFYKLTRRQPQNVMIYTADDEITFEKAAYMVDVYANKIDKLMKGRRGRILLYLKHSYSIILSILAVIKTGNSYVPVRVEKNNNLLEISNICTSDVVMTDVDVPNSLKVISVSEILDTNCKNKAVVEAAYKYKENDEVYVLFTSGSTGIPKGVSVTYGNLSYIIYNMISISKVTAGDVFCFSTPYTFDVSVTEIYSFLYGAKIFVYDTSDFDNYRKLPKYFSDKKVTHYALSPSGLKKILTGFEKEKINLIIQNLKCVMVAGEAFKKELYDMWEKNGWTFRLINLYGPTEATVYASMYEFSHGEDLSDGIPIGKCLDGADFFVDKNDEDDIGELVLNGRGIANGYINNKDENEKRFVHYNSIMHYRTGDMVSVKNNLIYFHGRNDNQIQLNGIRVELGEIENRLSAVDSKIRDAVVLYYEHHLIAFIAGNIEIYQRKHMEESIRSELPRYMWPNVIRFVEEIPLNPNNKTDYRALLEKYLNEKPANDGQSSSVSTRKIVQIMKECLGNEEISENSDFFECGADSLDTFQFLLKLEEEFGIELKIDNIYIHRTAEKLSQYILSHEKDNCGGGNFDSRKIEILKCVASLTKDIRDYLFFESDVIVDEYPSIHLQESYYREMFESTISFDFEFPDNVGRWEAESIVKRLIKDNTILRSKLVLKNDILKIVEFDISQSVKIPIINSDIPDIVEFVKDNYEWEIYTARYKQGYLALFVLIYSESKYTLVGIMDHTIADASCVSIIKNMLGNYCTYPDYKALGMKYADYCRQVQEKNHDIEVLENNWYIKSLESCVIEDKNRYVDSMKNKKIMLIKELKEKTNINISIYLSYIISEMLHMISGKEHIAVRTLFNLRDYPEYSFKRTIGDVHVGMSFVYNKGMTYETYKDEAYKTINLFSEDIFRPGYILSLKEYGVKEKQEKLKKIIETANAACINYLGEYSDEELENLKRTISSTQDNLYSVTRDIYVTAVSNHSDIYIFINKDIVSNDEHEDEHTKY